MSPRHYFYMSDQLAKITMAVSFLSAVAVVAVYSQKEYRTKFVYKWMLLTQIVQMIGVLYLVYILLSYPIPQFSMVIRSFLADFVVVHDF